MLIFKEFCEKKNRKRDSMHFGCGADFDLGAMRQCRF
jgi:hypothetical protein